MNAPSVQDLSVADKPVSDFSQWPATPAGWDRYRFSQEQLDFFEEYGYLSNIQLLEPAQVEQLREELAAIANPGHPGNGLFHEFHSNESADPETVRHQY